MTKTLLSTAASVCAMLALPTQAQTALFDCNPNSTASPAYNVLSLGGATDTTGDVAVNDTSSVATGWTINVTKTSPLTCDAGFSGGGATYNGTLPSAISGYDPNAVRDNIFFNAGVDWNGIAPVGGVIAFTTTVTGGGGALNFGEVVEVIPEPSSIALLGLGGLCGLCVLRRRPTPLSPSAGPAQGLFPGPARKRHF